MGQRLTWYQRRLPLLAAGTRVDAVEETAEKVAAEEAMDEVTGTCSNVLRGCTR